MVKRQDTPRQSNPQAQKKPNRKSRRTPKITANTPVGICEDRLTAFGGLMALVKMFDLLDFEREFNKYYGAPKRLHMALAKRMVCNLLKSDAVTLSPYMGKDSIEPFLDYPGTCSFVLCLTSNPSAADFQLQTLQSGERFYERVAKTAIGWAKDKKGEIGLVVGATQAQYLKDLRAMAPETVFLVPGVGTQGGDLQSVLKEGRARDGYGLLINVSRQVLYASAENDYADAAREQAQKLVNEMKEYF